jgi:hypothetical protein
MQTRSPLGGMLGPRPVSQVAVRGTFVAIGALSRYDCPSLPQRAKPVLVQALVAESSVERFRVRVLFRLTGLDQPQYNAAAVRPVSLIDDQPAGR